MAVVSAAGVAARSHHGEDALLLRVLHINVALVEFLPLADAVRLLSVCRTLRHDAVLASHALRTNASTSHGDAGCSSDWCALRPTTAFFDGREWAFCGGALDSSCDMSSRDPGSNGIPSKSIKSIKSTGGTTTKRGVVKHQHLYAAQSLSIAGFVAQRLYKWSFSSVSLRCRVEEWEFWQRVHDTRFVCRPLVVPLRSLPLANQVLKTHQQRWWLSDRDAVRAALNTVYPGFGDSFLSHPPSTSEIPSQMSIRRANDLLGYHWDAIAVSTAVDGHSSASCALCDWRECVIREYTARSPAMLSLGTTQIQHLHLEEDAILRQILGSEAQLPEWLQGVAMDQQTLAEWLYCALCRYHRRQCETFYQPLKQLFVQQGFSFVGAVDVDWVDGNGGEEQPAQLLAGVSPSGFLCGLYRMDLAGAR
ncbi:hypothetical protein Gpo141_00011664 [Globisporangium polare]